jgi:hypothetical protein
MGSPPLESNNKDFCWYSTHKTAGLAGLVCGASIRPNLLEGGGRCIRSRKVQEVILGITVPLGQ